MFYFGTHVAGALVIGRMLALNWRNHLKKNAATGLFSFLFLYLGLRSSLFLIGPGGQRRACPQLGSRYGMAKPRTKRPHG
ncbi:hypothetical protein ACVI1N_002033 [Sinorhizobium medicae]